jgi:hypothetical protein
MEEGYYTYGKILEALDPGFYLVHKTGCDKPYKCIYFIGNLLDNDTNTFIIFDTELQLEDYIKWAEEPESSSNTKSNILTLVKDKT